MKKMFLIGILMLSLGCGKDDDATPQELLLNLDLESGGTQPSGWWIGVEGDYTLTWTAEESNSPSKSLKIAADQPVLTSLAFWGQTIPNAVSNGHDVILSVKIKCKNVVGQGIAIAVRGDDTTTIAGAAEQFASTEGSTKIGGTFDWTTYTVKLTKVKQEMRTLSIFLMMLPNTTGTVYFDDTSLTTR
jgi:hypothetical protein